MMTIKSFVREGQQFIIYSNGKICESKRELLSSKITNPSMFEELMGKVQADVQRGWKYLEGCARALEPGN